MQTLNLLEMTTYVRSANQDPFGPVAVTDQGWAIRPMSMSLKAPFRMSSSFPPHSSSLGVPRTVTCRFSRQISRDKLRGLCTCISCQLESVLEQYF